MRKQIVSHNWKSRSRIGFKGWIYLFFLVGCIMELVAIYLWQFQTYSLKREYQEDICARETGSTASLSVPRTMKKIFPKEPLQTSLFPLALIGLHVHFWASGWQRGMWRYVETSSPLLELGKESVFMRHVTMWEAGGFMNRTRICLIKGKSQSTSWTCTPVKTCYLVLRTMRKN